MNTLDHWARKISNSVESDCHDGTGHRYESEVKRIQRLLTLFRAEDFENAASVVEKLFRDGRGRILNTRAIMACNELRDQAQKLRDDFARNDLTPLDPDAKSTSLSNHAEQPHRRE